MNQPHAIASTAAFDVRARLTFIVPQATKPYFESSAVTGGEPRVHFRTEQREVTIHDARPESTALSIDTTGFELRRHATSVKDLWDDHAVDTVYHRELEELLREFTGAERVGVFDFTRRSDAPEGAGNLDGSRGPASRVHVDYTVDSGPNRARDALGAQTVERVLGSGGRIAQVNAR